MATRSLNVVIAGDSKPLGVAAKQADRHMGGVEKSAGRMGKAVKAGFAVAAVGAGALAVGLKKSVDAAVEAEKSQARLKAQLNASGASYRAHAKEIDAVIQKHSKLAGVDDEDLQDAFTNIFRATGKVSVALKDMGLVTDLMRARNIDAAKAGDILAKVHNGNTGALKRLGIAIDPVTKAQDALKESNKKATIEQVRAAKEADKVATAQKAIAELQKRVGGQAEAYGKTAAGAQDRFAVAIENVQEKLGGKLLPVLATVADSVAGFLDEIDRGEGAGGRFAASIERVAGAIATARSSITGLVEGFRQGDTGARSLATGLAAVVSGFVAFKVITTVTAGVTALKAAWAGLTAAMATNPIGLVAVAIGAVVGALAVMSVNTRSASAASRDLSDALRAQAEALKAVRDIDVDVAQRKANLASANVAVEQAEKRLTDLRKSGKATATDIKQAEADLQQARVAQERATRDVGDAEADSKRKREDATKATEDAREKTRALIAAKKNELEATEKQITEQGQLAARFGRTTESTDALREKAAQLRAELNNLESKSITVKVAFSMVPGLGDVGTGDGVGKSVRGAVSKLAKANVGSMFSAFGGGLMGARASMAPFAAVGARFGVGVSSGRRPGAITKSGNVSFHSSGEALDLAGSPSGMLATFRALKSMFGSRLAELIYTPGGQGIKDGHPHTYTGQVAADHNDHVHVAFDTGTPGVGDGEGNSAYSRMTRGWKNGPKRAMSFDAVAALFESRGLPGVTFAQVAQGESGLDPDNVGHDPGGTTGLGLVQVTTGFNEDIIRKHGGPAAMFDPETQADAAAEVWKRQGAGAWRGTRFVKGWNLHYKGKVSSGSGGSSKGKHVQGPGPTGTGPDGVANPVPAPTTQRTTIIGLDGKPVSVNLPITDTPGLGPIAPGIKGNRRAGEDVLAPPTQEDFTLAALAKARLTGTLDDDIYETTILQAIRKQQMDAALATGDPRDDAAAIDAYMQVTDALKALNEAVQANTDALDEQKRQYEALIAQDYRTKYNVSQSQYAILAQAVTDVVSTRMGSTLGLGLSGLRAPAGSVARS